MMSPRVFISHSSDDADVAHALVDLLRSALNVPPQDIRCTSIEGHRLAGGAHTDEALRREIREALGFIGLISPASIDSAYVLFELGARWGQAKPLIPLLAPGAEAEHLRGPLAGMNALTCQSEEQLHQLVREVAEQLSITANPPESYLAKLRLLAAMKATARAMRPSPSSTPDLELTEDHLKIIKNFAEGDWKYTDIPSISPRRSVGSRLALSTTSIS